MLTTCCPLCCDLYQRKSNTSELRSAYVPNLEHEQEDSLQLKHRGPLSKCTSFPKVHKFTRSISGLEMRCIVNVSLGTGSTESVQRKRPLQALAGGVSHTVGTQPSLAPRTRIALPPHPPKFSQFSLLLLSPLCPTNPPTAQHPLPSLPSSTMDEKDD